MTAADLQVLHAQAQEDTEHVLAVTEQALLRGIVAAAEAFDHMAPLPDLHIRRTRSWEPAEDEKEAQA